MVSRTGATGGAAKAEARANVRPTASVVSSFMRGSRVRSRDCVLLADAELREDHAQQVVRAELAGDLVERVLREPQLLGDEVQRLRLLGEQRVGLREMRL